MTPSYDAFFVVLSIVVAVLASFAALDLAGRVHSESGPTKLGWIAAAGVVLGLAMWSVHFVGMRGFHLPVPIAYNVPLMMLSAVVAIITSLLALMVRNRPELGLGTIVPAGVLMGGAIAGANYIGMASMQIEASLRYTTPIVIASILFAIVTSAAALRLASSFRSGVTGRGLLLKVGSAAVMGAAISGTHYAALAAARFAHGEPSSQSARYILASGEMDQVVVAGAILIIILAVIGAVIDRNIQAGRAILTKRVAGQTLELQKSEQQYRLLFDNNPNPMWVYSDSTRRFLAVNEAAIRGYGYTRAEFLTMSRHDVRVQPEHAGGSENGVTTENPADPAWNGQHRKKNGNLIDVAVTSREITFDGQEACIALILDVTNQKRAAEALRQSDQRTRLILDNALDAVVTMGPSGAISDWNAQAERMFGWSRAEALGRQMSETIIPPRYRERHEKGLKKFLETGVGPVLNKRIEITALTRDGREFPVELAISPAKVGGEWTFSAFLRDLTERKEAEEALRLTEQRYQELFEDTPVGLYRSTPEGRLTDVNPAMVSMLGYPDRESLLATPAKLLYVDETDRTHWSASNAGGGPVLDLDFRMRRADGAVIWVRDTTHVKRDSDGRVLLFEGVLEDITARVEAERALQANERRLIQILEAVPLGIVVSDQNGQLVFANAGGKKTLGSGVVPNIGITELAESYQAYVAGSDEFYPVERMPLARALRGEASAVDDMELHQADRVVSLSVKGAPILDTEGKVIAAVVAFIDTSERRSLEAQVRQASKMEAVGQLAGGVAHDFNNLLTVIMSYGAMLLDRLDPADPNREDVQEIAAAADRAAALTRQLLAFSRKQVMQPQVIDINAVVGEVEKMLRRLIGEDIELQITLDPAVGTINADPGQLQQVLMNLVVNARDAMPGGGRLSISTSNSMVSVESAAGVLRGVDGEYVRLTVSDTGTGMTPEVQQRLFDPFFTTKDQGRGTGLGLSTVYGIVKQSGGEIFVYSEVGEGSSFNVYFPRYSVSQVRSPVVEVLEVPPGSETVLLVEDDANVRSLVTRVLATLGYKVLVAAGGDEALAIVSNPQTLIDVVITDVVMPGMNGRELIEQLVALRPEMGSLLMSGYTDDEVLRRGVMHGETAFLQKPFTGEQLARKVRAVLDRAVLGSAA